MAFHASSQTLAQPQPRGPGVPPAQLWSSHMYRRQQQQRQLQQEQQHHQQEPPNMDDMSAFPALGHSQLRRHAHYSMQSQLLAPARKEDATASARPASLSLPSQAQPAIPSAPPLVSSNSAPSIGPTPILSRTPSQAGGTQSSLTRTPSPGVGGPLGAPAPLGQAVGTAASLPSSLSGGLGGDKHLAFPPGFGYDPDGSSFREPFAGPPSYFPHGGIPMSASFSANGTPLTRPGPLLSTQASPHYPGFLQQQQQQVPQQQQYQYMHMSTLQGFQPIPYGQLPMHPQAYNIPQPHQPLPHNLHNIDTSVAGADSGSSESTPMGMCSHPRAAPGAIGGGGLHQSVPVPPPPTRLARPMSHLGSAVNSRTGTPNIAQHHPPTLVNTNTNGNINTGTNGSANRGGGNGGFMPPGGIFAPGGFAPLPAHIMNKGAVNANSISSSPAPNQQVQSGGGPQIPLTKPNGGSLDRSGSFKQATSHDLHSPHPGLTSKRPDGQPDVVPVSPDYFPIFNGSQWMLISYAAAEALGIVPNPQDLSHQYPLVHPPPPPPAATTPYTHAPLEESALSHPGSPPSHAPLSRQGSESGQSFGIGTSIRRTNTTNTDSRRDSLPPSISSRATSPDHRRPKTSPGGSPGGTHAKRGHHAASAEEIQEFMELLQRYDYLNAWSQHGKSKSLSGTGSPIEASSSVPRRHEFFEKSLVLKEITEWIESHRDYLLDDKEDMVVPTNVGFGNVKPKSSQVTQSIRVENHGTQVTKLKVHKIIPNHYDQLECLTMEEIVTHPAGGYQPMFGNIDLTLTPKDQLGFFTSWILILINDRSLVGRKITWHVTNNIESDREMDPFAKSYTPQHRRNLNHQKARMVVTGERVEAVDFQAYLQESKHPGFRKHNGKFSLELPSVEPMEMILPGQVSVDLHADSYAARFQPLLRVELHLSMEDVAVYNLFGVPIKVHDVNQNYFQIQVSGLSEQCPNVSRGDMVIIRQVTNDVFSGIEYRSFVHGTNKRTNSIYVHIPIGALPKLVDERWNVQFRLNDRKIREMYRAVGGLQELIGYHPPNFVKEPGTSADDIYDRFYSPRSLLFPSIQDAKPAKSLPSITLEFVDPQLNWEQKSAVQSVVRNDYGNVPFIISGPPGTGKTKTLVESVLQVLMTDASSHILVTAPSHSACDTIMKRLIPYLQPQHLLRLNDATRPFVEVPDTVMPYCYGSNYFDIPPLKDLLKFRVVVCTCLDASMLISGGASNISTREYYNSNPETAKRPEDRSHWTHLFIDEAGQAIEPETDIPLLCVLDEAISAPQIILCGDHQQLGPKTFLPELQYSYLERLMTTIPLYRDHPQSRNLASKSALSNQSKRNSRDALLLASTIPCFANLVQNYRSHPKMLMMPSHLFYNDTLVASAPKSETHSLLGHDILPNPDCPIVFIGVKGIDRSSLTEAVSWRNDEEAETVLQVILRLLHREDENYTGPRVYEKDIGVIAPFREQVKAIRQVLRMNRLSNVNVGTVEDYQGQEHRVILISTTRSRAKYLDQDVRQGLGLVHFRKRINVSLTRAKAMLIVIGNPELLILDDHWSEYLHFCLRNAAYTGCPLPDSVLNASANDQKRGGAGTMGRLELNDLVSQYVEKLDSRRWLGRRLADAEMENFVALPSDLEDEFNDSEEVEDEEGYGDIEGDDDVGGDDQEGGDVEEELEEEVAQREPRNGFIAEMSTSHILGQQYLGQDMGRTKSADTIQHDFGDGPVEEEDDAIRPEYDTHPIYYAGSSGGPTGTSSRASDCGMPGTGAGTGTGSGSLSYSATQHADTSMTLFEMEPHEISDLVGVESGLQKHELCEQGAGDKEEEEEEEEDENERRAKERHALGTLNVDGDTPDMKALTHTLQAIALDSTRKPMHSDTPELYAQAKEERMGRGSRSNRLNGQYSNSNNVNSANSNGGNNNVMGAVFRGGSSAHQNPYWMLRPAFQPPPPDHLLSGRRHSPLDRDLHVNGSNNNSLHVPSPYLGTEEEVSFPSSDRAFKRLSSSQLVLEKPFDPAERGISEYY
ncbi:hypothetical protein BGW41_005152 [Actinomortierella wolfii]|nr:hypothetical protein BGW41_005152 [Actinomortierella wolfii]